jgi:hypothetical protein
MSSLRMKKVVKKVVIWDMAKKGTRSAGTGLSQGFCVAVFVSKTHGG